MSIYYGLNNEAELRSSIRRACEIINPRNVPVAIRFLNEIAAAESSMGTFRDMYLEQGKGVFQHDAIGFFDAKNRIMNYNVMIAKRIYDETDIDLEKVKFDMFDFSPLLSSIFCRMSIYLIPEQIPSTRLERAKMWKKYYNTESGKGTIDHYMSQAQKFVGDEV